jgi:hypothetical protein
MAQGLLDHYVLPYLPPEDVEARRSRAREVRDKAAKRAADARRTPPSFPGSPGGGSTGGIGGMVVANAAFAHVFGRGSGISSIRVSGAANVNALQQLLQAHGRRVMRIGTGVRSNETEEPAGGGPGAPVDGSDQLDPMEAMVNTLRSTNDLLRGLRDSRRRREEQLADIRRQAREAEVGVAASQERLADLRRERPRGQGVTTGEFQANGTGDCARVTWTAVSSEVTFPTPCAHCTSLIPPCFLRLRRSERSSRESAEPSQAFASERDTEVTEYFHPNVSCLSYYKTELRGMLAVEGLADLSEQEQRVVRALRSVIVQETPR